MGAIAMGFQRVGMFVGVGVWLLTTLSFFTSGNLIVALLAFFVPPLDIVLMFVVSPTLGFIGIGAGICMIIGVLLSNLDPDYESSR